MPTRLFKFYKFHKDDHGLDNFEKDQAWLSLPTRLNDPFDCWHAIQFRDLANERFRKGLFSDIKPSVLIDAGVPPAEVSRLVDSEDAFRDLLPIAERYMPIDFRTLTG